VNKITSLSKDHSRRKFLKKAVAATGATAAFSMTADSSSTSSPRNYGPGAPPVRYPEPDVVVIDKRFAKYKIGNTAIERLHTGMKWAEGPAWNGSGRYLIWSDIPSDEQLRYIEEDSHVSRRFRSPSGNSNGNTFDYQGRQISCQHKERRVVRYEHNGTVSVLADKYNGKTFNAPNDAVVHPEDGAIWFTDPGYGGLQYYEGTKAQNGSPQPYQKEAIYRIDAKTGKITKLTDEIYKPNGLCFSPDYKKLYAADTGATHYKDAQKEIKVWDIKGTSLKNGKQFASMEMNGKAGLADGIRADIDGNVWAGCGWVGEGWAGCGWVGEGYDGVHIFGAEDGKRIGQILLPEICSNLCFGGTHRNRLFMTASQSLYSVYVETKGAHIS